MNLPGERNLMTATQLWPISTSIQDGRLQIADCDLAALAAQYGTPLYVLDADTIRTMAARYTAALHHTYAGIVHIHYASKALLNIGIAQLMHRLGLGLDVVSGGELAIAQRAGVPLAQVHLHGNGTPPAELAQAIELGVGRIIVDNLDQLATLAWLTARRVSRQAIMLRIAPDIADGAHAHIRTGAAAAKFGLPLDDGSAAEAVRQALAAPGLELVGLHAHIGSQLRSYEAIQETINRLLRFAAEQRAAHGWTLSELSPGGGLAVAYMPNEQAGDIDTYAVTVTNAVRAGCERYGLPQPRLVIEPGRSMIARAGVALYTVTGRKAVPGGLDYLHIDGGMGDNSRPAMYNAQYTAALVARPLDPPTTTVQIAGRYCESGDILIRDVALPGAAPGDLLAVPVAGAYTLSMSSTYNGVPRPPLLLLDSGHVHVLQRRETVDDLVLRDLPLNMGAASS
ncbi:MAG: diaminopimelate decarboxylase [Herpetosiphonaceae bacterium]|nr:diaminopimelate decarboxylase [Herpetosiphonaceae bacterium]